MQIECKRTTMPNANVHVLNKRFDARIETCGALIQVLQDKWNGIRNFVCVLMNRTLAIDDSMNADSNENDRPFSAHTAFSRIPSVQQNKKKKKTNMIIINRAHT